VRPRLENCMKQSTQGGILARAPWLAFLVIAASLVGCAVATDDFSRAFVDPTKFDLLPCSELANRFETIAKREQELRALMDKAAESTGGAMVSAVAYRTDYLNARGELKLLQEVGQRKNCPMGVKPGQ